MTPLMAAAAAIPGLARWVLAPGPWRPTKLRLDVETARDPGGTRSPLAATHRLQPGSRHWKPASLNTASRPSASAARLTCSEPGTTQALTPSATRRPRTTLAASRKSDKRELAQEPINTQSILVPAMGAPGFSPMYSIAASQSLRTAESAAAGSGTTPSIGKVCSGLVPQDTEGARRATSIISYRPTTAPAHPPNAFQRA